MRQSVERAKIHGHLRGGGQGSEARDDGKEKRAAHEAREPKAVPDGTELTAAYGAVKWW
jgi:hypothetical protein